ncbi:hypothetical protein [Streptomyces ipomoeae]|uniref:hypothetical protein n=1 Tax=Streptomyces ipomoeae TaxID=103232 RepID=UPI0011478ECA|nr:hypothetical protein [Streptomyces ipomoeae]MDX2879928.1 hypothetical protein [Streptomyces ipomoeae]TQE20104.1 hypothetical protein Sipo7851_42960 [Streptomyces ipomoeae]
MGHRIARWLFTPLLRFLRRPSRGVCRCLDSSYTDTPGFPYVDVAGTPYADGPTVHITGSRPPQSARPPAVPGIGIGSLGMPWVEVKVVK